MSEFHRASPSRTSPSTLKVTAMLATHPKSFSDMQRRPDITQYKSNQSNMEAYSLPLRALLGCCNACHVVLYLGPPLTCPTLTMLSQLLLTSSLHVLHFQTPRGCQQLRNMSYQVTLLLQKRALHIAKCAHRACTVLQIHGLAEKAVFRRSKWFAKQEYAPHPLNLSLSG